MISYINIKRFFVLPFPILLSFSNTKPDQALPTGALLQQPSTKGNTRSNPYRIIQQKKNKNRKIIDDALRYAYFPKYRQMKKSACGRQT
ncbi:hypothetical protein QBC44DRAFT_101872 [Cladorrhinum sp. PSN332]|nr:hypothetical protein QBC44DRAFT_101872 [Cladorrhinum sp. PSN332]